MRPKNDINLNNLISNFNYVDNSIHITFNNYFRNKQWRTEYFQIQDYILNTNLDSIILDFSSTIWLDPLPLLSLQNDMCFQKRNNPNVNITIILPPIFTEKSEYIESSSRIVAFLINEGFLENFNISISKIENHPVSINLNDLNKNLYYSNSVLIPATTINLNYIDDVLQYIETKINKYINNFINNIPANHLNETILKIKTTIFELVENVKKHAYPELADEKYCSFYVRYRKGLNNYDLGKIEKFKLENAFINEQLNCPGLKNDFAFGKTGFLEVFVTDSGVGLANHHFKDRISSVKYPFREAWRQVFIDGIPKSKRTNKTAINGILLLSRVLINGYINAFDGNEIIGDSIPVKGKYSYYISDDIKLYQTIRGFHILCRISINAEIKLSPHWTNVNDSNIKTSIIASLKEKNDIFQKYYKSTLFKLLSNTKQIGIHLTDNRFEKLSQFISKYSEIKYQKKSPNNYLIANSLYTNNNNVNVVIILGSWSTFKTRLFNDLDKKYKDISPSSKTMIIGDISDVAALIFEAALVGSKFSKTFLENYNKIILITINTSTRILTKSGDTYVDQNSTTKKYLKPTNIALFNPGESLHHYFEFIKSYDSFLVWFYISNLPNKNEYYIKSKIRWFTTENEIILNGYLNFSKTLSDEFLLKLYEFSFHRIINLINKDNILILGLDSMAQKFIDKYYYRNTTKITNRNIFVGIGSVHVSGVTQNSINILNENNICFHFFSNTTLSNNINSNIINFFHWPKHSLFNKFDEYHIKDLRRVGFTSTIAPGGWKYYKLPRYTADGKSLTFYNPQESYLEYQNSYFIKMGHYEYDGYHDLYQFNITTHFNNSFLMNGTFANSIIFRICACLKLVPSDFTETVIKKEYEKYLSQNELVHPIVSLLVYPYNKTNNLIISHIKSKIIPSKHNKFIGLISYTGLSKNIKFTISYLSVQTLENLALNNPLKNILIFDESIIEGKVSREIEHLLRDCGWEEVFHFNILDRRRLSEVNSQYDKFSFLYRLDIPRLGFKNECIICKCIKLAKDLSKILIAKICKERIIIWEENWSYIDSHSESSNHGISSKQISLNSNKKKFSVSIDENGNTYQLGGEDKTILITNSYGLTIYSSEIISMSKRDDFALEIISKERLDPEVEIELLSSTIMLYFYSSSEKTKINLIKELVKSFIRCDSTSNHTSIASLLLIEHCSYISIEFLYTCLYHEDDKFKIVELHLDAIITFALICYRNNYSEILSESEFAQIIISNLSLRDIYQQFHSQIYNSFGLIHKTALQKLCEGDLDYSKGNLIKASACIDKIVSLIESIDLYELENGHSSTENTTWVSKLIYDSNICNNEICKKCELSNEIYKTNQNNIQELLQGQIKNIFEDYVLLHNGLYTCIEPEFETFIFKDQLENLIAKEEGVFLSHSFTKPDYGAQHYKWFVWDSSIQRKLTFLINNKKHANYEKIKDPYNNLSDSQLMWINISSDSDFLHIHLYNYYDNNITLVRDRFSHKSKQERVHLELIGGNVEFNHFSDHIIETKLNIPFINYKS